MDRNDPKGIDERSLRFFQDVLTFVDTIRREPKTTRLIEQLLVQPDRLEAIGKKRSAPCVAQGVHPLQRVAVRSANETVRWLRACAAKQLGSQEQCVALLDEACQLARILGRFVVTSKRRAST